MIPRHREIGDDLAWTIINHGRFWYIEIPALDGATQGRRLGEVQEMAKDDISAVTETPIDDIALNIARELPETVQAHLARAEQLRAQEATARSEAAAESRAAAKELQANGLTVREAGTAFGVSHQRAQQLVSA